MIEQHKNESAWELVQRIIWAFFGEEFILPDSLHEFSPAYSLQKEQRERTTDRLAAPDEATCALSPLFLFPTLTLIVAGVGGGSGEM